MIQHTHKHTNIKLNFAMSNAKQVHDFTAKVLNKLNTLINIKLNDKNVTRTIYI